QQFLVNQTKMLIGHGDGLGPGDKTYKLLKIFFGSRFCQWLFARLHPNFGIGIAHLWSRRTRVYKLENWKELDAFRGDEEWILQFCKETEAQEHHDFYVFGHRHLPLDMEVSAESRYINLGEWFVQCTFASFDGEKMTLETYEN
ncbi:MAG: UDP-2,3-diacylglucosamine diphosphatase, partial [Verrucomicrobia bacterium]|nr:UDP-2,3-diacylglucosamine diphosphatase [Cytophagales bacterium]